MPDFADLTQDAEKEIQSHPQQADDAIKKADQEADSKLGGDEQKLVDDGADKAEQDLTANQPAPPANS
jgi:hypothetical protein